MQITSFSDMHPVSRARTSAINLAPALPLSLLLMLAACSERDGNFRLELPITASDHAAIIAVFDPGDLSTAHVYAAELDGAQQLHPPIAAPFDFTRGISVAAALYEDSLDALFIDPGELASPAGAEKRPLPTTGRIYESRVDSAGPGTWALSSVVPEPIEGARLPALSGCVEFTAETHTLPQSRKALFVTGVPTGAVIGTEGRLIYHVNAGTIDQLEPTTSGPCGSDFSGIPQYYDGYYETTGTLWLASRCGEVHKADIDLAAHRLSGGPGEGAPHRDSIRSVDGPETGTANAVFIGSELGQLDKIDVRGSISTMLTSLGADGDGEVLYVTDDEAFFAWDAVPELLHATAGIITTEALPSEVTDSRPRRLAHGGVLGLVAGNNAGEVFYRRTDTWRLLAPSLGAEIESIAHYRDGILVLDANGELRMYSAAERKFCDPIDLSAGSPVPVARSLQIGVSGDHVIVAGQDGSYHWLTPR